MGRVGGEIEIVEGEEYAVGEELVSGEDIGLRERRVSDHPELEFRRVGISGAACSSGGNRRERVWLFHFFREIEVEENGGENGDKYMKLRRTVGGRSN